MNDLDLTRTEQARAEAAGYVFLDELERALLAEVLHEVLAAYADRRAWRAGLSARSREEVAIVGELRERIRPPYSSTRRHYLPEDVAASDGLSR